MNKASKIEKDLKKSATLLEEPTDKSDIPKISAEEWHEQVGQFCRPMKQAVTMCLDADVLN